MLSERICFIVTPKADASIQLGIAEPAGVGITSTPTFKDRQTLKLALEGAGLPERIALQSGFLEPRRVSFQQLVSLGFS